jgi:hypothetical protein
LPGQFAYKVGVVNQINFSVTPRRSKNKLKYGIEKGNIFLKKLYFFLKFYAISESRKLRKSIEADDNILRHKNYY